MAAVIFKGRRAKILPQNGLELADGTKLNFKGSTTELDNLTLTASVASNALTIALKTKAGTDPTSEDLIRIGFRNSTLTSGSFNTRTVTAATSLVISSGSTLGHANATAQYIYVYAIDNAGTVELAASSAPISDLGVVSTTAEGGAGAADSGRVLYSTTARTNVPARLIGRLLSTQTTAGTWASAPTEVVVSNQLDPLNQLIACRVGGSTTVITNSATTKVIMTTKRFDTNNAYDTTTGDFTCPVAGRYEVTVGLTTAAFAAVAAIRSFDSVILKNGVAQANHGTSAYVTASVQHNGFVTDIIECAAGDTISAACAHDLGTTPTLLNNAAYTYIAIKRIGGT